jgi:hypothetical protein
LARLSSSRYCQNAKALSSPWKKQAGLLRIDPLPHGLFFSYITGLSIDKVLI